MKRLHVPPTHLGMPKRQCAATHIFLQWEQLPTERQRELILTLAAMLTRQLPAHLMQQEVRREPAS